MYQNSERKQKKNTDKTDDIFFKLKKKSSNTYVSNLTGVYHFYIDIYKDRGYKLLSIYFPYRNNTKQYI